MKVQSSSSVSTGAETPSTTTSSSSSDSGSDVSQALDSLVLQVGQQILSTAKQNAAMIKENDDDDGDS